MLFVAHDTPKFFGYHVWVIPADVLVLISMVLVLRRIPWRVNLVLSTSCCIILVLWGAFVVMG
jgi:hypothetical protein